MDAHELHSASGPVSSSKYLVNAGWDDVPHLSEQAKAELLAATPPYLREARSKGIPSLGAGAIYPIPLDEVQISPFVIPPYWRRGYGLDVGWNKTAAVWVAEDPSDGVLYAFAEYYAGRQIPAVHATGIKARGDWMMGAIDPASRGRTQDEGKVLFTQYQTFGLNLVLADNAVEPGLYRVWELLSTGRLRFFSTMRNIESEYRLYRRGENGKVVKKNDHLMDALRYAVMTFSEIAQVRPSLLTQVSDGAGMGGADRTAGY